MSDELSTDVLPDAPDVSGLARAVRLPDAGVTDLLGSGLGRSYADSGRGRAVLYLYGDLGAGKTATVRSLLRGLGVDGLIRSPTYTLLEVYQPDGITCVHVDLYRMQGASLEVEELGLRDRLEQDLLLLVEWPEKGAGALPPADLDLRLQYAADIDPAADPLARRAMLHPRTPRGRTWLAHLVDDDRLSAYVSNLT